MNFFLYFKLFVLSSLIVFQSCKEDDKAEDSIVSAETVSSKPNILLIIADDMGKDATSGFSEGTFKPTTPTIDSLRNNGLSFSNFWVNPTCSPTRATIITGKYGYRTGVKAAGDILAPSETILQKYINQKTNYSYSTAIIGKWHLSGNGNGINPETFGLDYYTGLFIGAVQDYYSWKRTEDGTNTNETEYITAKFTNLAIDWVKSQEDPWFLWLAYNAPHTPFHAPPANTHSQRNLAPYSNGMDEMPYYLAAIESMDYEIERLLSSLSSSERENTIIIFIGDNGTPNQVAQLPYSRTKVKNTLYQGGINTPMIISGKGVSRRGIDENLITSTDLFSTISTLAGATTSTIHDSKNFSKLLSSEGDHRTYQYSEIYDGNADNWTISNGKYKLIVKPSEEELYDLITDPYENTNLLNSTLTTEAEKAKKNLDEELLNIRN